MDDFYTKIRNGCKLSKIRSVSWNVKGEDLFKPERCSVVLEDVNGERWELVIHSDPLLKNLNHEDCVILNTVLSYHKIHRSGKWLGLEADIPEVVNELRKNYPYRETFFVNEKECLVNEYTIPIHRF